MAATWIGNAATGSIDKSERQASGNQTSSHVTSGGFVQSTGQGGAGSANIVDPALAAPVDATCIGGSHIGNANATDCSNTVDTTAGNGSHTTGDDSTLTGNVVNTQAGLAPEVYGVGGTFVGQGNASSTETKNVTAGAYDGSTGNNSSGSGNIVQVPVSGPVEVPGVGGAAVGQGSGTAHEQKVVSGGGGGNTADDNGFLSSNLATTPVSLPAQAFGIGGAVLGQGHGLATTDTTSNAGGDVHATGNKGAAAGNLIQAPVSLPTQAHGLGAAGGGIGTGDGTNLTDSTAGGKGTANGKDGAVAGNIVQLPVGGAASVPGHGVAAAGIGHGTSVNDVMSAAGGQSSTNGDGGSIAGNIIGAQALPVVPAANDAVSGVGGLAGGTGSNTTAANSGGDVSTSGVEGSLSGDILDIPAAADPKAFGDAVSAVGAVSKSQADNQTIGQVGGESTTDGNGNALSGFNFHHPFVFIIPADGLEVPVLAAADSDSTDMTSINEAPEAAAFTAPLGSEMGVKDLPALPVSVPSMSSLPSLSALPLNASALPVAVPALPVAAPALPLGGSALPALPLGGSALPALPATPALPSVPSLNGAGVLPTTPAVDSTLPQLPLPGAERADVPAALPVSGNLAGLTGLTHVGTLPTATLPTASLPKVPAVPATPALPNVPGVGVLSGSLAHLPGQTDERADVPAAALPQLPVTALPQLPKLPVVGNLPMVGALPVNPALPAAPATTLPAVPATGVVPALPVQAQLPVLNAVQAPAALPTAQVPALAGMDSSPLSLFQKVLGMFGKKA